jgi:hypothetical protein
MNESPSKIGRYAVIGIVVLSLIIILAWFAFRQEPPPPNEQPMRAEVVKPIARAFEPANDLTSETPTNQPSASAITNAADLYRQAFALYAALTNDEKNILRDWQTNVDAAVEVALCEKIRPICDLMHQASAVTNCDWGVDLTTDTLLPYLGPARNIARAAIWSAAHCRTNDVTAATDDAMAVLKLGQQVSRGAMLGCLVDMALQRLAAAYVSQNLGSFQGADAQRLAAAFNDPTYQGALSRAMEQEAEIDEQQAAKQAATAAANGYSTNLDQIGIFAAYKQSIDSERQLAKALTSSSQEDFEAWQQSETELKSSSPLTKLMLSIDENFLDHVQAAEVNRSLVVAGLAVAQGGTDALQSNPDPSSGQPFVYAETPDGFELRSTYQVNGKPMTMQFRLR